jgi:hypothetical protein
MCALFLSKHTDTVIVVLRRHSLSIFLLFSILVMDFASYYDDNLMVSIIFNSLFCLVWLYCCGLRPANTSTIHAQHTCIIYSALKSL